MRIKEGFLLHQVGDECIVMQDGSTNVDFSNIISLNPTAALLWKELDGQEFDAETVARMMTEHYEVTSEEACRDAENFIKKLQEAGVMEE